MALPSLNLEHVSKRYWLKTPRSNPVSRFLLSSLGVKKTEFWALHDVNLELRAGKTLGVIGVNGSGKSTLLKLMAGVSHPTAGTIHSAGSMVGLLELGAGFHPDLTGYQNIYLQCNLLGMRKAEIDQRIEQIVEFSGLGPCLDWAVKRYSSGMYARLGFSVAVHVDAQIILVDETLSVGDAEFQRRSVARMHEIQARGDSIIVFVTHDIYTVSEFCDEVIWLDKGRIAAQGDPTEVCQKYWDNVLPKMLESSGLKNDQHLYEQAKAARPSDSPVRIRSVQFETEQGVAVPVLMAGKNLQLSIDLESSEDAPDAYLSVYFVAARDRSTIAEVHSEQAGKTLKIPQGKSCIQVLLTPQLMLDADYRATVLLHRDRDRTRSLDAVFRQGALQIVSDPPQLYPNVMTHPHTWRFENIAVRSLT